MFIINYKKLKLSNYIANILKINSQHALNFKPPTFKSAYCYTTVYKFQFSKCIIVTCESIVVFHSVYLYAFPYARAFGRYMIVWDCTDQPVQSFHVFLWDNSRANAGLCIRLWPISVCNSIAPVDKTWLSWRDYGKEHKNTK
jgi:hypothetical protein